jgi:predicted nucleic acid-binding protein
MKVLVDTNIVLDWWLSRQPFEREAQHVLSAIEAGRIEGCLCATAVTTMPYFATKGAGAARGREAVAALLKMLEVAPVNRSVLAQALESGMSDFEDAVACYAACEAGAQAIVTRDKNGFRKSPIRVLSCSELMRLLEE